jgi:dehypoxanthine futalosine cyclase
MTCDDSPILRQKLLGIKPTPYHPRAKETKPAELVGNAQEQDEAKVPRFGDLTQESPYIRRGKRLSREEGLSLFTTAPLNELRTYAEGIRQNKHPGKEVTFVLDTNPNYTNICHVGCAFCAFRTNKKDLGAYHKSVAEVMEDIRRAVNAGLSTVLLQGGLHEEVTVDYLVSLVRSTRELFPSIHPHFFSAPEIDYAARISNMSVRDALQALYHAGQRTIPGGGAEILSPSVHGRISPNKLSPSGWLLVHRTAHEVGFKTTATMMYGHLETPNDIIEHLDSIRSLQDETGGFTCFIPWSYKRQNNPLGRLVPTTASPEDYLRIIAFSRIYLDNFDHISASWFGEGKNAGVEALHYGADDFGGTVCEEAVHKAAGHDNKATQDEVKGLIRQAGFEPVQRDSFYSRVYTGDS